jgi:elongation factor P
MITTSDFKQGIVFEDEGEFWQIITYQQHRMSQSRSTYRVTVRALSSGNVFEKSYREGTKFRDIPMARREKQYIYDEGANAVFMDMEDYEQVAFPKERLGDQAKFLQANMQVLGVYVDGKLVSMELPANVVLTVTSTVPGIRGDSVSNMVKPATLETGLEVQVPLFIKEGDKIKVDTRTGAYIERAKE